MDLGFTKIGIIIFILAALGVAIYGSVKYSQTPPLEKGVHTMQSMGKIDDIIAEQCSTTFKYKVADIDYSKKLTTNYIAPATSMIIYYNPTNPEDISLTKDDTRSTVNTATFTQTCPMYTLKISYPDGGSDLSVKTTNVYEKNSYITIFYNPNNPKDISLEKDGANMSETFQVNMHFYMIIGGVVLVILGIITYFYIDKMYQNMSKNMLIQNKLIDKLLKL